MLIPQDSGFFCSTCLTDSVLYTWNHDVLLPPPDTERGRMGSCAPEKLSALSVLTFPLSVFVQRQKGDSKLGDALCDDNDVRSSIRLVVNTAMVVARHARVITSSLALVTASSDGQHGD
ncbi:hypothetical protein BaRGS_00003389 [Batillaria attramentaria]|uniref:Uncharacterized protein n=1 Tax=Batillaria attramentaria TaxID=370345 RepID=A0ABD0M201_9CAEN